jgi:hypothetical protein
MESLRHHSQSIGLSKQEWRKLGFFVGAEVTTADFILDVYFMRWYRWMLKPCSQRSPHTITNHVINPRLHRPGFASLCCFSEADEVDQLDQPLIMPLHSVAPSVSTP